MPDTPANLTTDLTTIVYPNNLVHAGNRYGNQFMAIYINVDIDTKPPDIKFTPTVKDISGNVVRGQLSDRSDIPGSIIDKFQSNQGGKFFGRSGSGSTTLKSIYLPIPLNISANAEAKYEGFDFGTEATKLGSAAIGSVADLGIAALKVRFGNIAGSAFDQMKSTAEKSATFAVNAASAKLGKIINPHKQLLFKGVELRNFTFQYKLVARDKTETDTIDYIIRLLRYHMLPDLGSGFVGLGTGLALTYPSEFDMAFYMYDGTSPKLNPYLPAISTCVLTKMDVTYGEKEIVSHVDGSPVELTLSLSFQETQVMTKSVVNAFDSYIHGEGLAISQGVNGKLEGAATTQVTTGREPTVPDPLGKFGPKTPFGGSPSGG